MPEHVACEPGARRLAPEYYAMAEIEEMLTVIQRLDPSGIGARDLRECLLIQLREKGETETLDLPPGVRGLPRPDRPPLERPGQALRGRAGGGAGRGRQAGPVRPQARPQVLGAGRRLHHPRPHRGQDRRPLPRLPERHRRAPAPPEPLLPGDRARQEEDDPGEPRVHRLQDEQRQLDDSGHRAAPPDHAQGHELHRGPAA